ncbi:MAG: hypothetical protein ACPG8W_23975 [Candidatus Promineifilaceae bacterium]
MKFTVEPLLDRPIIHQSQDKRLAGNVNGPSLIRVPAWVQNPLGAYYLYFAHHEGQSIRLATADSLSGPWTIHWPGALTLEASSYPATEPKQDDLHEETLYWISIDADGLYPHIASPDVIVDDERQEIRLYHHGRLVDGRQRSRVAVSQDGLTFSPREALIGGPYMRMMQHQGVWYGLAMPGDLYRTEDGLTNFTEGHKLFTGTERHYALLKRGDQLIIFLTRIGDAPERILASTVDISAEWTQWAASEPIEVHRATDKWEGAELAPTASLYGTCMVPVNQLRDPAIFEEDGEIYLLYAVQGEQGIGIGRLIISAE